jgi:hypothetical protein
VPVGSSDLTDTEVSEKVPRFGGLRARPYAFAELIPRRRGVHPEGIHPEGPPAPQK